MKAVIIEEFGGPETLQLKDIPVPPFGPEQILVRVKAAGVNPVDWKIREGYLAQVFPYQLPITLGWDVAGIVESVGEKVSGFKPGDRVYGYNRMAIVQHGSYAEYTIADTDMLAAIPENLDFAIASTIPLVALTAWQAVVDFAMLQAGESLFVTAGAGGVGGFAIQIAKYKGARVCTAASDRNHAYLQSIGVDAVFDYHHENLVERIREFSNGGVDVVFDCTGSEDVAVNFNYVKPATGRVVTINGLLHTVPELEQGAKEYDVKAGLVFVEPNGRLLTGITGLLESEKVNPLPVEVMPLAEAKAALEKSQAGHVRGKIALQV